MKRVTLYLQQDYCCLSLKEQKQITIVPRIHTSATLMLDTSAENPHQMMNCIRGHATMFYFFYSSPHHFILSFIKKNLIIIIYVFLIYLLIYLIIYFIYILVDIFYLFLYLIT